MLDRERLSGDVVEGKLEVPGGTTIYRIYGFGRLNPPLFMDPGGPGLASLDGDMDPYKGLAVLGNCPVVLRDPVGCGKAALQDQESVDYSPLWTIDRSARELASAGQQIQQRFGYEKMHYGGLSAGGIFLAEAVIRGYLPLENVQSFLLQSPMFDLPLFQQEAFRLLKEIDPQAKQIIDNYEAIGYPALAILDDCLKKGDMTSNAYVAATTALEGNERYNALAETWEQNHVFGPGLPVTSLPEELKYSNKLFEESGYKMFQAMVGPFRLSEVTPPENSQFYGYSILERLAVLGRRPTFIVTGELDEITPLQVEEYGKRIPGSKHILLPGRAHMTHFPPEGYLEHVSNHLEQANTEFSQ